MMYMIYWMMILDKLLSWITHLWEGAPSPEVNSLGDLIRYYQEGNVGTGLYIQSLNGNGRSIHPEKVSYFENFHETPSSGLVWLVSNVLKN